MNGTDDTTIASIKKKLYLCTGERKNIISERRAETREKRQGNCEREKENARFIITAFAEGGDGVHVAVKNTVKYGLR